MKNISAIDLRNITHHEWMTVVVICAIGALALMARGTDTRSTCLSHGYVWEQHTDYCTKVQGGNTIVIHVDSLR